MKLPITVRKIDSLSGHLKVAYDHSDDYMNTVPINKRENHLVELHLLLPKLDSNNLLSVVIWGHELGHIRNKSYLVNKDLISKEEFIKGEYEASAYTLIITKEEFHEEILQLSIERGLLSYVNNFNSYGSNFSNNIPFHKEEILKEYHKIRREIDDNNKKSSK